MEVTRYTGRRIKARFQSRVSSGKFMSVSTLLVSEKILRLYYLDLAMLA